VEVSVVEIVEVRVEFARREYPTNAVRSGYEPVDDFTWKRGQRYRTLVCDFQRRRIIDLHADRQADDVADGGSGPLALTTFGDQLRARQSGAAQRTALENIP
jgi:hypothetical protein